MHASLGRISFSKCELLIDVIFALRTGRLQAQPIMLSVTWTQAVCWEEWKPCQMVWGILMPTGVIWNFYWLTKSNCHSRLPIGRLPVSTALCIPAWSPTCVSCFLLAKHSAAGLYEMTHLALAEDCFLNIFLLCVHTVMTSPSLDAQIVFPSPNVWLRKTVIP